MTTLSPAQNKSASFYEVRPSATSSLPLKYGVFNLWLELLDWLGTMNCILSAWSVLSLKPVVPSEGSELTALPMTEHRWRRASPAIAQWIPS